jgi:hypothetical protein
LAHEEWNHFLTSCEDFKLLKNCIRNGLEGDLTMCIYKDTRQQAATCIVAGYKQIIQCPNLCYHVEPHKYTCHAVTPQPIIASVSVHRVKNRPLNQSTAPINPYYSFPQLEYQWNFSLSAKAFPLLQFINAKGWWRALVCSQGNLTWWARASHMKHTMYALDSEPCEESLKVLGTQKWLKREVSRIQFCGLSSCANF